MKTNKFIREKYLMKTDFPGHEFKNFCFIINGTYM